MKPGFGLWVARCLRLVGARRLAARLLSRVAARLTTRAEELFLQGCYAEAAACYELVRDLTGPDAVVLGNLAACYRECGRYTEAVACCRLGLSLAPDDPVLHNNMALCLEESGRLDLALEHYTRAVAAEGTNPVFAINRAAYLARLGAGTDTNSAEAGTGGLPPALYRSSTVPVFYRGGKPPAARLSAPGEKQACI